MQGNGVTGTHTPTKKRKESIPWHGGIPETKDHDPITFVARAYPLNLKNHGPFR
jgi:hypothetical protein